jgi:hypothetical protein
MRVKFPSRRPYFQSRYASHSLLSTQPQRRFAIEYSKKGFETLTYLNGGVLVALPAALAFFKADVPASNIIAVGQKRTLL